LSSCIERSALWSLPPEALLAALYETYSDSVRAHCRTILGDVVAAEDATQETFLRVYRNLDQLEETRHVRAWIHRIAFNYCLNEIRNHDLRRSRLGTIEMTRSELDDSASAREELRDLLRLLPEPLRILVRLYYLDGLDQGEIAEELGVSRRTIVNRFTELRHLLGGFFPARAGALNVSSLATSPGSRAGGLAL